jgi:iron-sulfur cluster repair protein YtfE (RIC family)
MAQEETQPQETAEEQKTFTQQEVDALIKKRLARVKNDVPADYEELKSKARKFDELEEANKSELQKANEQLEKLKSDIAKRDEADKLRTMKAQVSKETGVPAELISGTNEDEMKEFAESVAKFAKRDSAPTLDHAGKFASATKETSSAARNIARQIS